MLIGRQGFATFGSGLLKADNEPVEKPFFHPVLSPEK